MTTGSVRLPTAPVSKLAHQCEWVCGCVDATEHAVEIGDLLTTSDAPGFAMKTVDRARAFGAVLGKAMQPLAQGEKGLVLVLVALQ